MADQTLDHDIDLIGLRCSDVTRAHGVDPIGSAGGYTLFCIIDWPLRWPRDVGEIEALRPVQQDIAAVGGRMQCVIASDRDAPRRVAVYRAEVDADGRVGSYRGVERVAAAADVVGVARSLVADARPRALLDAPREQDVLICTHGRRDRCCGAMGTALARQIGERDSGLGPGARLQRTSHLGGHRFAPTALVLPQATSWAFVDHDALQRIVDRRGPLDDLLPRYRGFAGHSLAAAQPVERHAFSEVGWPWLDHRRVAEDLGGGRIRLTASSPHGEVRTWEALVSMRRVIVPVCGEPLEAATKTEGELRLDEVRELTEQLSRSARRRALVVPRPNES